MTESTKHTSNFSFVVLRFVEVHGGSISVQRIHWIGVGQQLWEKGFENVRQIIECRPGLIDYVQTNCARAIFRTKTMLNKSTEEQRHLHFIDVWVVDFVHKANRW